MNILAFDGCFGAVSAAIRRQSLIGQWVQNEAFETSSGANAERLFHVISVVLDEAGLSLPEVDRIAVTLGPGTFTGVRVGMAAARGLALATGKPVVGTSSLSVIAAHALRLSPDLHAEPLVVAVDARRGALYVQSFGPRRTQLSEPMILTPEEAARRICDLVVASDRIYVVGSGAAAVADALQAHGREARIQHTDIQPHAGALARLATDLPPLANPAPIYLRQPDARAPAKQPQYLAQP